MSNGCTNSKQLRRNPPVIEPLSIPRTPKSLPGQIEIPFPIDATESNAPEDVIKVKKKSR